MHDLTFNGEQIVISKQDQIINMGGPWVGDLSVKGFPPIDMVLIDCLLPKSDSGRLYFVRYHRVSKWEKNNYFTLEYLDSSSGVHCRYDHRFKKLFLKDVLDSGELIYHDAFHGEDESNRRTLALKNIESVVVGQG